MCPFSPLPPFLSLSSLGQGEVPNWYNLKFAQFEQYTHYSIKFFPSSVKISRFYFSSPNSNFRFFLKNQNKNSIVTWQ